MSGHFEWFDARPGGGYRLILSYDDPGIAGKSEAHTDIADVRFVAIDTPRQVIEEADFVSDDPRLSATMTITWSVAAESTGSRVTVTVSEVPEGISKSDHDTALASTLANLADYLAAR